MSNTKSWQGIFLEREKELKQLEQLWNLAKSGQPQLTIISGHPGQGKTRLVQEFYHHASTVDDGVGEGGYWPDRLSRERDALSLSPHPADCIDEHKLPYLWWGFKLVDQGSNNAGTSSLHEATDLYLYPHFAAMRRAALLQEISTERSNQFKESVKDAAKVGAETGIGMLPVVGPFITAIFTSVDKIRNRQDKLRKLAEKEKSLNSPSTIGDESKRSSQAFEEEVLRSIRDYIDAGKQDDGLPQHPVIMVIDDAQFSTQDAAATSLMLRILDEAWSDDWPLLLIMTYWPDRWHQDIERKVGFPYAVHSKQSGCSDDMNSSGLLDKKFSWTELKLEALDSLHKLVESALPGASTEQRNQLADSAQGNPRYLERLLQLLLNSPALFVDNSSANPLKPEALESIIAEKFDLHEVTLRLIQSADIPVQQAVALGGMIGNRFRCDLINELGHSLSLGSMQNGLQAAERPLHILSGVDTGIAEFHQGVFRSVARTLAPRVVGPITGIEQSLEILYEQILDDWHLVMRESVEGEQMIVNLLNRYTHDQATASQRLLCGRSLLRLLEISNQRGDVVSATATYERWKAGSEKLYWDISSLSVGERNAISHYYNMIEEHETAEQHLLELVADTGKIAECSGDSKPMLELAQAHLIACGHFSALDKTKVALDHAEHAINYCAQVTDEKDLYEKELTKCSILSVKSDLIHELSGTESSHPYKEEALLIARSIHESKPSATTKKYLIERLFDVAQSKTLQSGPADSVDLIDEQLELARELSQSLYISETRLLLVHCLIHKALNTRIVAGYATAEIFLEEATTLAEALYKEKGDALSMVLLSSCLAHYAVNLQHTEQIPKAKEMAMQSASYRRFLVNENNTRSNQSMLSDALQVSADIQREADGASSAMAAYTEAVELHEHICERRTTSETLAQLCHALRRRAHNLLLAEQPAKARIDLERFISLSRANHQENDSLASKKFLRNRLLEAVPLTQHSQSTTAAIALSAEAIALARQINVTENSQNSLNNLCAGLSNHTDLILKSDGHSAAVTWHEEILGFRRDAAKTENTSTAEMNLINALVVFGDLKYQLSQKLAASDHYQEARERIEALYAIESTPTVERLVVFCINREDVIQRELYGPATALTICEESAKTLDKMHKRNPSVKSLSDLAGGIGRLAALTDEALGASSAIELAGESVELWSQVRELDSSCSTQIAYHDAIQKQALLIEKTTGPANASKMIHSCVMEQKALHELFGNSDTVTSYGNALYQKARIIANSEGPEQAAEAFVAYTNFMENAYRTESSERLVIDFSTSCFHSAVNQIKFDDSEKPVELFEKGLAEIRMFHSRKPSAALLDHMSTILSHWQDAAIESRNNALIKCYSNELENVSREYDQMESSEQSKKMLSFALARVAGSLLVTDGADVAKPVTQEYLKLIESTDNKNWRSYEAAKNRSVALNQLAKLERHINGPARALDIFSQCEKLLIDDQSAKKSIELERQHGYLHGDLVEAIYACEGPKVVIPKLEKMLTEYRSCLERDHSQLSLRNILWTTVKLAEVNLNTSNFEACERFIAESERILEQLADVSFDDTGLWHATARRDCALQTIYLKNKWKFAFSGYSIDQGDALELLHLQQSAVTKVDEYFGASGTVRHAYFAIFPVVVLSWLQLNSGQQDQARRTIEKYEHYLNIVDAEASRADRIATHASTCLFAAQIHFDLENLNQVKERLTIGIDCLQQQLVHSPFTTLSRLTNAHWLLAKALDNLDEPSAATETLQVGFEHATAFSKYQACDGQLMLEAYRSRLEP